MKRQVYIKMRKFIMFITAVCVLFLIRVKQIRTGVGRGIWKIVRTSGKILATPLTYESGVKHINQLEKPH